MAETLNCLFDLFEETTETKRGAASERYSDEYLYSTTDLDDLCAELEQIQREYAVHSAKHLHFVPTALVEDDKFSHLSEDAIADARACNPLSVELPDGKFYPIREVTAEKTMLERYRLACPAMSEWFNPGEKSQVLNMAAKFCTGEATVLIEESKVGGILSAGKGAYSPIDPKDAIEAVRKELQTGPLNSAVFHRGSVSHETITSTWKVGDAKRIFEEYFDHLKASGYSEQAKKFVPCIRLSTSVCASGALAVEALFTDGKVSIPIGDVISVHHRWGNDLETFKKQLPQLYAKLADSNKKLLELSKVKLEHPGNAFQRVCKAQGFPKKQSLELVQTFEDMFKGASEKATAEDAWFMLHDLLYQFRTDTDKKRVGLEEKMARVLQLNWADYDLATKAEW